MQFSRWIVFAPFISTGCASSSREQSGELARPQGLEEKVRLIAVMPFDKSAAQENLAEVEASFLKLDWGQQSSTLANATTDAYQNPFLFRLYHASLLDLWHREYILQNPGVPSWTAWYRSHPHGGRPFWKETESGLQSMALGRQMIANYEGPPLSPLVSGQLLSFLYDEDFVVGWSRKVDHGTGQENWLYLRILASAQEGASSE